MGVTEVVAEQVGLGGVTLGSGSGEVPLIVDKLGSVHQVELLGDVADRALSVEVDLGLAFLS